MSRTAIPFHISIGPCTSGTTYPVRARFEHAETRTELQLPDHVLDAAASLLEPDGSAQLGDAALFGRALGRALLTSQLRDLLLQSVKSAAQAGGRLQFQLHVAPAELAPLPWELITIGLSKPWSPALRADYALVRVNRGGRHAPPAAIAGPLHILAVAAPGEAQQLDALELALADVVRAGRIELRLMRETTPATLEHALMTSSTHILHIAAPVELGASAGMRRGTPQLMLRRSIDAFGLIELLAHVDDLRLVTLAGPKGDAGAVQVGLPALAGLLSAEVLATIAFGGPLPARMSACFAAACYGRLAAGDPVDLAVTAGRCALAETASGRNLDIGTGGWGLAQLRLAPGGEQLFAFHGRPRAIAAGLRRPLILAGAIAVLLLALLLGARAIGGSTTAHTQALAAAATSTPPLPTAALATPAPKSGGLLNALFGEGESATATLIPMPTEPPTPFAIPNPTSFATFMTGPNDTLESIAQRMGSDPEAIASLNHLDAQVPLRAERALVIPVYRSGEAGAGGLVINRGNRAEPKVALTFDIEIDEATLYSILDILRARGIHGTFFVTGHWVMAYPNAARAIVSDRHEISNHSFSHPYFSRLGLDSAAKELDETEKLVQQSTGVTSRPYFRFPYGDSTPDVAAVVARAGYVAYHWSADDLAISAWLDRVAQNPADGNGGILLMHGRPETVASLPGWLDRLAAMGLRATTLTDTLR